MAKFKRGIEERVAEAEATKQMRAEMRLVKANEATLAADAAFFSRHPDRRLRLRTASRHEVEFHKLACGLSAPPEMRLYAVVRQTAPGIRVRAFLFGPEAGADDVDSAREAEIHDLFCRVVEAGLAQAEATLGLRH